MSNFGYLIILVAVAAIVVLVRRRRAAHRSWKLPGGLMRGLALGPLTGDEELIVDAGARALADATVAGWGDVATYGTRDLYVIIPGEQYDVLVGAPGQQTELHRRIVERVPELYGSSRSGRGRVMGVTGDFRVLPVRGDRIEAKAVARGSGSPFREERAAAADRVVFLDAIETELLPDGVETGAPAGYARSAGPRVVLLVGSEPGAEGMLVPCRPFAVGRSVHADLVVPGTSPGISREHLMLTLSDDGSVEIADTSRYGVWVDGARVMTRTSVDGPAVIGLVSDGSVRVELRAA